MALFIELLVLGGVLAVWSFIDESRRLDAYIAAFNREHPRREPAAGRDRELSVREP